MAVRYFIYFSSKLHVSVVHLNCFTSSIFFKHDLKNASRYCSTLKNSNDLSKDSIPSEYVNFAGAKSNFNKVVDLNECVPIDDDFPKNEHNIVNFKYQKIDKKSSVLSHFMLNVKSRKRRTNTGQIFLEGKRLIEDALHAGVKPVALFFSRVSDVKGFKLESNVQLFRVSYKNLQFWSNVSTCQGVFGIFSTPDTTKQMLSTLPLTIVCDNVRDPGNLGSILRTSAAVGCSQLLLTKGCVDLWEPKVLRTAAGAHFRLRIYNSLSWENVHDLLPNDSVVYLADSQLPEPEPGSDLLDVYEVNDRGEKISVAQESLERRTLYQRKRPEEFNLPLLSYTEPDFSSAQSLVLVLGGETHGLSDDAFKLAVSKGGARVYIPLENGVESLNSGTALGVLAYEIRRKRFMK